MYYLFFVCFFTYFFFFFKQKTAYEMRISDWSSDVCSSDLRIIEIVGLLIDVTGAQAHVDAALLAFDGEAARTGEAGRQRLRAAHAAEPGGEYPLAGEVAAVMLPAHFDEGFVRALHDALRADVDP